MNSLWSHSKLTLLKKILRTGEIRIWNLHWCYFIVFPVWYFIFIPMAHTCTNTHVHIYMKSTTYDVAELEWHDSSWKLLLSLSTHCAISYFHPKNRLVNELEIGDWLTFPNILCALWVFIVKEPHETIICGKWIAREHLQTFTSNTEK